MNQTGEPIVSVMMPAYNAERHMAQAIESVLGQRLREWELVVVDDGSTDASGRIAASYGDSRIRVVRRPNGGEAAARNTALEHLRGDFVAFLDADDLFLPNHLEVTVGHLRRHPEHGGVYTDGYYITHGGRRLKTLASRRRGPMSGRVFDEVVRGPDVFGPPLCVVLRRNLIGRHGLKFDESIVIGPDWDFFVKVADRADFGYVDEATCLYRVHETNITQRVGLQRRALELAKCRTNAIKLDSFGSCPLDVRVSVFYDLLVDLLRERPDAQEVVLRWPEFTALPSRHRARLLRLMASKAILHSRAPVAASRFLARSVRLRPADVRALTMLLLWRLSPRLCKAVLRVRTAREPDPLTVPPFADLDVGTD